MAFLSTDYQIARRIGISDTAEVLLAAQQGFGGLEKLVVVKRALPHVRSDMQFVQVYLHEARRIAGLKHHNIAEIYDVHYDEADLFVVMEYVSGEDLGQVTRTLAAEEQSIPFAVACRIIAQAADGLHFAYSTTDAEGAPLGILHGGVCPGNVIVTFSGVVKLTDFGSDRADAQNAYARPATLRHKLAYRSPERIQHRELDHRNDVYSLGVLLYELLVGRRLFKGENEAAVLKSVMELRVPPPSELNEEVPADLDALVLRAIERDPDERLGSALELRDALDGVLSANKCFVSEHEVSGWIKSTMEERFAERQRMERSVVAEAREASRMSAMATDVPPMFGGSAAGTDTMTPSVARSVSGMAGPGREASQSYLPGVSRKAQMLGVTLVASLAVLLMALLFAFAYWIGHRRSLAGNIEPPAIEQGQGIAAGENSPASLFVHVFPEGASLEVDGQVTSKNVGLEGALVPVSPGRKVTIQAQKQGYTQGTKTVVAPQSGVKHVYINLRR